MGIEKEVLIAKLLEDKHITFKEALILMDQKSNQNINYNPYSPLNPDPNNPSNWTIVC